MFKGITTAQRKGLGRLYKWPFFKGYLHPLTGHALVRRGLVTEASNRRFQLTGKGLAYIEEYYKIPDVQPLKTGVI